MRMNWKQITFLAAAMALGVNTFAGSADAADWGAYQVEDRRSGYTYMTDESRAMQKDNFQNPGMLWVEQGAELWGKVDGKAEKSCASCHSDQHLTCAAKYPVYDQNVGKMQNIEQQINYCLETRMEASPYKWESDQMLSMTAFISNQSLGMPVNVKIDGPAAESFEKGKAFYAERRGQLDLACKHCHDDGACGTDPGHCPVTRAATDFRPISLKWVQNFNCRFRGR